MKSHFIVIDGLDASGKETQTALLAEKLTAAGKRVQTLSFPRYGTKGAVPCEFYLSGGLGAHPDDTGAYAASVLFAVDRYFSYRTEWKECYEAGDAILLANRYTTANAVHQLSKLPQSEWDEFLSWLWDLEFRRLGIPAPDRIFYLELPPRLACRMLENRAKETDRKKDIHEADPDYLARCYRAALYASEKLGWELIRCEDEAGEKMRPRDEILAEILERLGKDG